MKIGLSFSRCVRDIVDGVVDIHDVLVVISRTNIDPRDDKQWKEIWDGYGGSNGGTGSFFNSPEWMDYSEQDEDRVRSVSIELWESGKLHQPRQFGAHVTKRPEYWLETVLPSSELERNPAAKLAWEQFQLVARLTSVDLNQEYQ